MREILTLQVGTKSNFVGTHLWNEMPIFNESFDDSVMHKTSEIQNELTLTPRLLICDYKGSFGTYNQLETSDQQEHLAWEGKVHKIQHEKHSKNAFLSSLDELQRQSSYSNMLTSSVKVWADFNSRYYHPNSILELPIYHQEEQPFSLYTQGQDISRDEQWLSAYYDDRLRLLMEECDSPQGFNILVDIDDGFSGIGGMVIEQLREDYSKSAMLAFGISDFDFGNIAPSVMSFNHGLFLRQAIEHDTSYFPIFTPMKANSKLLDGNFQSLYQRSGFLASALESILSPFRLSNVRERVSLFDIRNLIHQKGASCISMGYIPVEDNVEFHFPQDSTGSWTNSYNLTLKSNGINLKNKSSWTILRGLEETLKHQKIASNRKNLSLIKDEMRQKFVELGREFHLYEMELPCNLSSSFPQYFNLKMNSFGILGEKEQDAVVTNISAATTMHSDDMEGYYHPILQAIQTVKQDRLLFQKYQIGSFGIDDDEIMELSETLGEITTNNI